MQSEEELPEQLAGTVGFSHSLPHCMAPSVACCVTQSEEELPERLAGTVRFSHLRLKDAAYLDEETGKIYKGGQSV
jgi:hypothetical protein